MARPVKRSTSQDVARAAGVSRTTVSFVLNNTPGQLIPAETRRRVIDAAQRLDYHPHASARTLAAGRSDVVLLAIPDLPIGPGISRFVEELATALAAHGLTLVIHLAVGHGRPLPDVCASIDASAVIGFDPFDRETVQALHRAGADIVIPADTAGTPPATAEIGRFQADHLISRGHRRIGYAMPAHPGFRQMAEGRLRSVTDACAAAGLDAPVVVRTSLEIADAARAVTQWTGNAVTGICAFNDETAIAVLAGMREHGLIAPDDLAVIGADDIPTARLATPPLSTVHFDLYQVGKQHAEAVLAGLSGDDAQPTFVPIIPRLVQRAST